MIKEYKSEDAKTPFFFVIETLANHYPYGIPPKGDYTKVNIGEELSGNEETTLMHRLMRYDDDLVSDFLSWMQSAESDHLLDETIVVVTADHGFVK